ncbi:MAG: phosphomannomutase/phosphoglucomutase [Bacillati bacterium ANGP1]|uniref:Phosphomannomutase/phosphoglucomutase n=1 Tax=Candidatus Segetimicrobium genomatis TaxID=2569760 RepID=A0A537LSN9_9BACT|nr:MAG: phosphomannomutase/phosphoglucomutase [Terrabacteria group bacterium ANGP1]
MTLSPTIFREYDIRGIVGRELDPEAAEAIARAFGTYLANAGVRRAVIGHDNRASSPALYEAAVRGLASTGCDVITIGLAVTPMLYFAQRHFGVDGGVMVTASHNPPEFNGFKLAHGPGTLYGAQIQEIRRLAEVPAVRAGAGAVEAREILPAYAAMLRDRIRLGPRRLRVVADCGNGTASGMVPDILRAWEVDVIPLYCDSDPTFPHHHPDPVDPQNLRDLIREVAASRADVGLGFDGDGDRIGAVDDHGEILWGDLLMALFWREILAAHPGATALVEVKCSQALIDEIRRLGGRPQFTPTGHSLIKARMRDLGAVFAGEMSGHMFFADEYYGYDDAIYAAGRLLRILSRTERPLSALAGEIPRYHNTPEIRVACPDDRKHEVVARLVREFKARYEVIDIDGVRVVFPDGWGLVRASNTQPVLVVRAEGTTPEALDRIKAVLEAALRRYPEVAPVPW